MNDLERAMSVLAKIREEYPAVFRAFGLDEVLECLERVSQR